MANPVNAFDFSAEDLATFLAKSVDDGTYADLLNALKVDEAEHEATATQITDKIGQLYGNVIDDFVQAAYPLIRAVATGTAPSLIYTTGAAKTGAYNAAIGEHVRFDGSGGSFVITLPASPSANDRVGAVEVAGDATQVDVSGNGNNIVGPGGSIAGSASLMTIRGSFIWKFDGQDSIWRMESLGS